MVLIHLIDVSYAEYLENGHTIFSFDFIGSIKIGICKSFKH